MEQSIYAINENRLINTSVIREINGTTTVDGHIIDEIPITIKVGVEDLQAAEELNKHMQVSKSSKEFFMDNYHLSISHPHPKISIPAYGDAIRIQNMEFVENNKGG